MRKTARAMSGSDLEAVRLSMGLDMQSMAAVLGWPYRTYQDREYGRRGITDEHARQVAAARKRDRRVTDSVLRLVEQRIARDYPHGIVTQPECQDFD